MTLIDNWRSVLKSAWSVRLGIVAAALSGIEVALPLVDLPIGRGTFAALSGMVTVAALVARLVAQRGMHGGQ